MQVIVYGVDKMLPGWKFGDGKGAASVLFCYPSLSSILRSHCSFLRWENSCWNIHGGFELGNCSGKAEFCITRRRISSHVFPHIVQVCARSNGSWHDPRCIVVNYPNSGVEWHSTTIEMCTQTSLYTRWTSQIYSLPVNCYAVYLEADVLLLQTVFCYVESRRWKCSIDPVWKRTVMEGEVEKFHRR